MSYTQLYQLLKAEFSPGKATLLPGEDGLLLKSETFRSNNLCQDCTSMHPTHDDSFDIENKPDNPNDSFSYPVFYPNGSSNNDNCIILLHGLNERSWDKYLPWGYQLAHYTKRPVILFPIAYHMNRSPINWSNPRAMMPYVKLRKQVQTSPLGLSVANVALSQRLTDQPERFLLSGYQSANDVLKLIKQIKSGLHPSFKQGTQVDFFAYSIGTFLTQNLMLAHGEDHLAGSKFFFFCGGSTFADMKGVSKYIMDEPAFNRLINFYSQDLNSSARKSLQLRKILNQTTLGQSFASMVNADALRKRGQACFSSFKDRMATVSLTRDKVILPEAIKKTLAGTNFEEWNFDFNYSHEVPFPILTNKLVNKVNEAFDKLFIKAALLFTH